MTAARTLGIVDWGIGGIGLLQRLDVIAPRLPVVYWSDTGAVPYGKQEALQLSARLRAVVVELARRGCTEAVLACHSASTVVDRLDDCPIPVTGIIEHALRAVPDDLEGTVGIVGGRRTITEGVYRRALGARGLTTVSAVAQPLSAHIEAGRMGSAQFRSDLRDIVEPIRGAQALVLACTHYPAAAAEFAAALPGTLLIDPAATAATALADGRSAEGDGSRTFLTTGDPHAMRRAAKLAWDYTPVASPRSVPSPQVHASVGPSRAGDPAVTRELLALHGEVGAVALGARDGVAVDGSRRRHRPR